MRHLLLPDKCISRRHRHNDFLISTMVVINYVSQERLARNPWWLSYSRSFSRKRLIMLLCTRCSRILQVTDVRETSQIFYHHSWTGVQCVLLSNLLVHVFSSAQKCLKDLGEYMSYFFSCNFEYAYVGIESGPAALCGFRSLSSLMTPFKPILILGIDGGGLWPLFGMELIFSCVHSDWNWSFRMSAFLDLSLC